MVQSKTSEAEGAFTCHLLACRIPPPFCRLTERLIQIGTDVLRTPGYSVHPPPPPPQKKKKREREREKKSKINGTLKKKKKKKKIRSCFLLRVSRTEEGGTVTFESYHTITAHFAFSKGHFILWFLFWSNCDILVICCTNLMFPYLLLCFCYCQLRNFSMMVALYGIFALYSRPIREKTWVFHSKFSVLCFVGNYFNDDMNIIIDILISPRERKGGEHERERVTLLMH